MALYDFQVRSEASAVCLGEGNVILAGDPFTVSGSRLSVAGVPIGQLMVLDRYLA